MVPEIKQIADRIRELRDILELTPETVAAEIGVSVETYLRYENAETDIPIGKLYLIAHALSVDPTVILMGDTPRMVDYSVIRGGKGVRVDRYAGYCIYSLAYNFIGREMEPMIVELSSPEEKADLVSHEGQEFNYALEGDVEVTVGKNAFVLHPGDSIYFNPALPHGQRAVGGPAKFLTVINERMAAAKDKSKS
ncbi:MAG: XRE family transcriptional regulator [Clostridia bacterium]|nr:XRE family transcriptional regulator [Clostridia bacterium]